METIKVGDTVELYTCGIEGRRGEFVKITATIKNTYYDGNNWYIAAYNHEYPYLGFERRLVSQEEWKSHSPNVKYCCKANSYVVELL